MGYSSLAQDIRSKARELGDVISSLEGINFNDKWSGDAHDNLITDLNDSIKVLKDQENYSNTLANALEDLQSYKDNKKKISDLYNSLNNVNDIPENSSTISYYREKISNLQDVNDSLRRQIGSSISVISSTNIQFELVNFQPTNAYKEYVVDLHSLLATVQSGKLDQISKSSSLYNYYDRDEFLGTIDSIKQQYSGRDAVVNCAIGAINMAASVNKSIGYELIRGTNALQTTDMMVQGTDCCTFASWALSQGSDKITKTYSTSEFKDLGNKIDYSAAKPGDIFSLKYSGRGGHVMIVVENNPETGRAIVAESKGEGVVLTDISYKTLSKYEYQARDLSSIY